MNQVLFYIFLGASIPSVIVTLIHLCWSNYFKCIIISVQKARSYKAAVVEYAPTGNVFTQTPAQVLGQNLNNYNQLIQQAASLVKTLFTIQVN